MFGVNCAPEMFQKFMEEVITGIEGVMIMIGDIIVHGQTFAEHQTRLSKVKQRLFDYNLTINESKSLYNVPELDFLGFRITVQKTNHTTRSFLGLVSYVGSFIHHLADKRARLQQAIKTQPFQWTDQLQQDFDSLRKALEDQVLLKAYFRRDAETYIYTDSSGVGLGAVLIQKHREKQQDGTISLVPRIIAFASKSLTEVEERYAQTHREALAVVWGVEHFFMYLFGTDFIIMSDHEPLKFIFGPRPKLLAKRMMTRAEGWALRLQPYRFKLRFVPGQ